MAGMKYKNEAYVILRGTAQENREGMGRIKFSGSQIHARVFRGWGKDENDSDRVD
jgi:hypothetical protein